MHQRKKSLFDKEISKKAKCVKRLEGAKETKYPQKNLKIVHVDARGLKSKINSIKKIITEDDLTSMCLVEIHMEYIYINKYKYGKYGESKYSELFEPCLGMKRAVTVA